MTQQLNRVIAQWTCIEGDVAENDHSYEYWASHPYGDLYTCSHCGWKGAHMLDPYQTDACDNCHCHLHEWQD